MNHYKTKGTCSTAIDFDVQDGIITHVKFTNGCGGNVEGLARLIVGMQVDDAIERLSGIECRNGTSCPDQLARALKESK